MFFHCIPNIYNKYSNIEIDLVDISIPEANLVLHAGIDVVARTPYPNKCLKVACKKKGTKAIEGLLIKLPDPIDTWSVVTRWAMSADTILTHKVNYSLMDNDYNTVTDSVSMWGGFSHDVLGHWEDRHPFDHRNTTPIHLQPRMDLLFNFTKSTRDADFEDIYLQSGLMVSRSEKFVVPTIQKDRLFGNCSLSGRIPPESDAFTI